MKLTLLEDINRIIPHLSTTTSVTQDISSKHDIKEPLHICPLQNIGDGIVIMYILSLCIFFHWSNLDMSTLNFVFQVLMVPAIFLLRFGVTNLMYVNVDMWLLSVVSSAFIILVTIILILSYCCWSHHQPTHPEFCFTMISAVGLCILGTLLLLLDHGRTIIN